MRDFTEGDILKQLIYFTIPMLLANLLQALYSVIDGIFVGRLIGHEAFAAVSSTTPMIFFLVSAIIGLTISTNILIAQAFGAKNMSYLSKVLTNSFITSLALCLVLTTIGISLSNPLLNLINTPSNIRQQSHIFFTVFISGLTFNFMYNWFSAILRGLGDSKTPLYLLIMSLILNAILEPILILGWGPIPKLGVAGSALGTITANFIMIIISYFFVLKKHILLNVRQWDFTIDWGIIKKIFTIGIPASLQMITVSLSGVLIMSLVNNFGSIVTAAAGIGIQLDQLSLMPSMAIGISATSMIAQNLGATKYERIKEILKLSLILSFCFSTFFFAVIYGFPELVASIFTKEQSVILLTHKYIRIVSFSYFIFSAIWVLQGVVRGAGDTMYMLVFSLISLILFRYGLAYLLSKYTALHETGIWLSILLSTFVALLLNYIYYISGRWKKKIIAQ